MVCAIDRGSSDAPHSGLDHMDGPGADRATIDDTHVLRLVCRSHLGLRVEAVMSCLYEASKAV